MVFAPAGGTNEEQPRCEDRDVIRPRSYRPKLGKNLAA
jgi:hypothetical protein